jgi:hypothetical protein
MDDLDLHDVLAFVTAHWDPYASPNVALPAMLPCRVDQDWLPSGGRGRERCR